MSPKSEAVRPSPVHSLLMGILGRYVSPIMIHSVVSAALGRRRMDASQLGPRHLLEFAEEVMGGVKLFCDPKRLPDLTREVADLCYAQTYSSQTWERLRRFGHTG